MAPRFSDTTLAFITLDSGICNQCCYVGKDGTTCRAFPRGIPDKILRGEVDHRKPYEGDRGIRFKPWS